MRKRIELIGRKKHTLPAKMKALAADALAQKVGYLHVDDFPGSSIFAKLPRRQFNPKRLIRVKNGLCLVSGGRVQIRHSQHDYIVKELTPGALFGDMPLLGQTMLATEAVAGTEGAIISFISRDTARAWIRSGPVTIVERIGSRLALVEAEHYSSNFQLTDSRIAHLILELAGDRTTIEGLSHEMIGDRLSVYRETVTHILKFMEQNNLIEVGRKRITILDKKLLRELSKL